MTSDQAASFLRSSKYHGNHAPLIYWAALYHVESHEICEVRSGELVEIHGENAHIDHRPNYRKVVPLSKIRVTENEARWDLAVLLERKIEHFQNRLASVRSKLAGES